MYNFIVTNKYCLRHVASRYSFAVDFELPGKIANKGTFCENFTFAKYFTLPTILVNCKDVGDYRRIAITKGMNPVEIGRSSINLEFNESLFPLGLSTIELQFWLA